MTGIGAFLLFILVANVVRVIIRGVPFGAFRKSAESGRGKPDLSATWSAAERVRKSALLQDALKRRGDGGIRVSCIVLESERTTVVPPRFLMVKADLSERDFSFERKAEITYISTSCLKDRRSLRCLYFRHVALGCPVIRCWRLADASHCSGSET